MRYFLIFAFSLPVFAQDWGRYTQPQFVAPNLAEMQVMRTPVFTQPPSALPKVVPNQPFKFPTPPGVGQNVKK